MRKNTPTFKHGKIEVLFSDDLGPGPLVYKIFDDSKMYIVMMNTSSNKKHATGMDFNIEDGSVLRPLVVNNMVNKEIVYSNPYNILLNAKSLGIFE